MATTQSTPGQVEFLIKKYPGGKFSGLLDGGIRVGDELSLTGPYGTSTLKDGHVLPVVCVAGGAGMAPILSLLRHMSETASIRGRSGSTTGRAPRRTCSTSTRSQKLGKGLADFAFVACLSETMDGALPSRSRSRKASSPTSSLAMRATSARPRSICAVRRRWWMPRWPCSIPVSVPKDQVFYDSFTSPIFD